MNWQFFSFLFVCSTVLAQTLHAQTFSCERQDYLKISQDQIFDQTEEPKTLTLRIVDKNYLIFQQGDEASLEWREEVTFNDLYEMRSEHFWLDKQTMKMSFVIRQGPMKPVVLMWYDCH